VGLTHFAWQDCGMIFLFPFVAQELYFIERFLLLLEAETVKIGVDRILVGN